MSKNTENFPPQQQEVPGLEQDMHPRPEVIRENYKGCSRLGGKVALITGGDSGIGRSVAVHFAREGADVAIIYLCEDKDAEETRHMVEQEGVNFHAIRGNIQDKDFCRRAVEEVKSKMKHINILVNNASEQHPHDSLEDMDPDMMEKTFRTNIIGMFHVSREVVPDMKEGDTVINTTSVTSFRGSDHLLDYSSSKGAITAFTRSLSKNLASKGIRVNGVAPGPIWTPLIPSTFSEEEVKEFGKKVPMGRAGQPSEVGPAYVFLASADASYITGQIIHINGGEIIGS